jgi:serine protease inhibitor
MGQPKPSAQPKRVDLAWKQAILLGLILEVLLVLSLFVLPSGSGLLNKAACALITAHFPLAVMVHWVNKALKIETHAILSSWIDTLEPLLIGVIMVLLWAAIIRYATGLMTRASYRLKFSPRTRKSVVFCLAGFCILALTLFAIAPLFDRPRPFTSSPDTKALVEGNTAFALDLYRKLASDDGNTVFSPYVVSTALGMVCAGARTQTETEIVRVAHFNLSREKVPLAFANLEDRTRRLQRWPKIRIRTANSLWYQQNASFSEAYINLLRDQYRAKVEPVDFVKAAAAASDKINSWGRHATSGEIPNIITPAELTAGTRLALCNAIYFKGRWENRFDPSDTKPSDFFVSSNCTVTVPMMCRKAEFKMVRPQDSGVALLDLPYHGQDLSMIVILPEDKDGLPKAEATLTSDTLQSWLSDLEKSSQHDLWAVLPRFSTARVMDLTKPLAALGITNAFSDTSADFSGMDRSKDLHLSIVKQRAMIEVDESGTKAAAINLGTVKAGISGCFIANHPFIFLIRDNGSGNILFMGRIQNPKH